MHRPPAAPPAPAVPHGVFVTLEGVDGAGKTTQCALLCAALEACGREAVRLREPGGTRVGEGVRALLLDPCLAPMDPVCELLLFEAARAQLVAQVVRPALARGAVVVSDRFFDSTLAYQGFARGLGADAVRTANRLSCGGLVPDRTVVLDLDPALACERARGRGGADRIEQEGLAFQEHVRAGFLDAAREEPDRVRVVDASGDASQVWSRVRAALAGLLDDLPDEPAETGARATGGGCR